MVKEKKIRFKTVALCSTKKNNEVISIANQCHEVLSSKGVKVLADKNLSQLRSTGLKISSEDIIRKKSDFLIAIGGDGTMLNCARKFGQFGIPILGINLGNLGFLNDIAPNEVTQGLIGVIEGGYDSDKRFFLETSIKGLKKKFMALNEVVIHSGDIAQLIEYEVFIDDVFVYKQKADGLIISSPTGSTGYSLSSGGPIVHPKVNSLVLSPMLPLSLSSSSLVIDAESKVKVILAKYSRSAQLSFDSNSSLILKKGGEINVCKSNSFLELIHPKGNDFFGACRNKLRWSTH